MKKLFVILIAGAATLGASAQVFRPDVLNGAALGAIAGAVIGNNSGHHNGARGAAIGAVAGAMIGGMAGDVHRERTWGRTQVPRPRRYDPYDGCGYRHDAWGWYDAPAYPVAGYGYPAWDDGYGYDYPDYSYGSADGATRGLILGGIAGAIIGNNSGHRNGARGAIIGAALGSVLGSIHDANVRRSRPVVVYPRAEVSEAAPAPAPAQQAPVTIINNYYVTTPMSGANALFGRN